MSDGVRLFFEYLANVGGAGFVVFLAFAQLADFMTDRNARRLVSTLAWFVLLPIFVLRTAGIPDPPLLDKQLIADWSAVLWSITLLLAMIWASWLAFEKRHAARLRKELSLEAKPERKNDGG